MGTSKLPAQEGQAHYCLTCQNRESAEWCVLADDALETLNKEKTTRFYRPGQMIYSQGDPSHGIFCIEVGNVALRKSDADGGSTILRLAQAGQTLGYPEFFSGRGYNASAEALGDCTVCHVDGKLLRQLLRQNPSLGLRFLNHIAGDLADAEDSGMRQALYTVRIRLAHLLLTLRDRYACVSDDGTITLTLPMNRQDIAAMLGARPETIYRTIQQLESDNVATFVGHEVIIPDLDVLLDEIEGDSLPS